MNEVTGMGCDGFADVAAELALGVLTGRERARAIAHLDGCEACMEHVRQLAVTSEKLLELLPGSEPPPGFETRVLGRLGISGPARTPPRARRIPQIRRPPRTRPPRVQIPPARRILTLAAAAAVIAAAGGAAGWGLHGATAASPATGDTAARSALRSAMLMTASHHAIGEIFLHGGSQPWLYMAVDTGFGSSVVNCQLESRDGRIITVGSFRLNGGYGYWGNPVPLQASAVTGARLTSQDGTILATASFSSAW
jgi:hypothetical protein